MEGNFLDSSVRVHLKTRLRYERDSRVSDRIKAVLLADQGWSYEAISEALFLDSQTISRHVKEYVKDEKLKPENGGSEAHLKPEEATELVAHLEEFTYSSCKEIASYIKKTYAISYAVSTVRAFLKTHGFSYKKAKGSPAKADLEAQETFKKEYEALKKQGESHDSPDVEPILFMDSVHPSQQTRLSYGWIKKGQEKLVPTTAGRKRVNIMGALNLETMSLSINAYEKISADSVISFFRFLEEKYSNAKAIHIICDQAGYHKGGKIKEYLKDSRIKIHYLPAYSPNLNPIERVWKVMHEVVSANRFFPSFQVFLEEIMRFLKLKWNEIKYSLIDRINDSFQIIKPPNLKSNIFT